MDRIFKGMIAGFVATVVLSGMMLMKTALGLMPQLDVIAMLSRMLGAPDAPAVGWAAHFLIGSLLWGGLFGWLADRLPGASYWIRGMVLGVAAWVLMMVLVMPMAGAGLFAVGLGIMAPIATLVLHLVFGAVLGGVFGTLIERAGRQVRPGHGAPSGLR